MNVFAISVEIFSARLAITSPNPIAAATGTQPRGEARASRISR